VVCGYYNLKVVVFGEIKVSAGILTLFRTLRTVGIRLFCKREPNVLFFNASGFIISAYKAFIMWPPCTWGFFIRDSENQIRFAVFKFFLLLVYFLYGFAVFGPPYAPSKWVFYFLDYSFAYPLSSDSYYLTNKCMYEHRGACVGIQDGSPWRI